VSCFGQVKIVSQEGLVAIGLPKHRLHVASILVVKIKI
jgi:hypothetical protein